MTLAAERLSELGGEPSLVRSDFKVEGAAALRILAETAYPVSAASARVRVAGFAPFLRPHGVELDYRPNLTVAEYAALGSANSTSAKVAAVAASSVRSAVGRRPEHDLLLVHRLRLLTPLPGIDPPRRVDIYDLDDAVFLGSTSEVNKRFSWAKRESQRSIAYLRRARLVTAGNSYLAENASRYAARVEIVPTCVDPESQPLREHSDGAPLTVGWIGSASTSEYVDPLLPVFERLNAGGLRAKLVLIGAPPGPEATWLERRSWTLENEPTDLASFDVGIMPLPATEWARGKCGYKLLQYFAAGVPAIASPVGVAPELIGSERGLLAADDADWERALHELLGDAEMRRQMGHDARRYVEDHYSYQRWERELAAMLRSLAA